MIDLFRKIKSQYIVMVGVFIQMWAIWQILANPKDMEGEGGIVGVLIAYFFIVSVVLSIVAICLFMINMNVLPLILIMIPGIINVWGSIMFISDSGFDIKSLPFYIGGIFYLLAVCYRVFVEWEVK